MLCLLGDDVLVLSGDQIIGREFSAPDGVFFVFFTIALLVLLGWLRVLGFWCGWRRSVLSSPFKSRHHLLCPLRGMGTRLNLRGTYQIVLSQLTKTNILQRSTNRLILPDQRYPCSVIAPSALKRQIHVSVTTRESEYCLLTSAPFHFVLPSCLQTHFRSNARLARRPESWLQPPLQFGMKAKLQRSLIVF